MFFIEWLNRPVTVATVFLTVDPWYWDSVQLYEKFVFDRLEGLPVYQVELDYSQMPLVMG